VSDVKNTIPDNGRKPAAPFGRSTAKSNSALYSTKCDHCGAQIAENALAYYSGFRRGKHRYEHRECVDGLPAPRGRITEADMLKMLGEYTTKVYGGYNYDFNSTAKAAIRDALAGIGIEVVNA
jgi:hypothetical protein